MAIILRIDVDKPFGVNGLANRIKSKIAEDYFCIGKSFGYLSHLRKLINVCNENNVTGHFYFRICTLPTNDIIELLKKGNHIIGLHAENTNNYDTFSNEFDIVNKHFNGELYDFTKHGSGKLKLGKFHYPPYEPEKYIEWAKKKNTKYILGNGIVQNENDFVKQNDIYQNMFWLEHDYRNANFNDINVVIELATSLTVPIIMHPCSFDADIEVYKDFQKLISAVKSQGISWSVEL